MLDITLIIIIFSSLGGIFYIILGKTPELASIRIDIIPSEQQLTIRNRIISNRLKGKFNQNKNLLIKSVRPFWLNFTSLFWKIYRKILEKERHLQQLAMTPEQKESAKQKVDELLEQATKATKDKLFMRAERLYIKIISLETHNLDAYDGLVKMYLIQKDYQKAKETLKYLLNLVKKKKQTENKPINESSELDERLVQYYLEIGNLYQYQGENSHAIENFMSAIKIDENNPKALNRLLEMSIITKDIILARVMIEKIKKSNPNNKKIIEWERRIDDLTE